MDMVATESSMHGPNGCDGRVCLHENRTQGYSRLRFFSQVHSLTSRNILLSLAVVVLNCLHSNTAKGSIKAGVGQVRAQTDTNKQQLRWRLSTTQHHFFTYSAKVYNFIKNLTLCEKCLQYGHLDIMASLLDISTIFLYYSC